jgi:exopolysaccharide biosynthesis polyprenyl glycosylphosphotransferase
MLTPAPSPIVEIVVISGISLTLCWLGVLLAGLRLSGSLNERILVIGGGPLALRLIDEVAGHPSCRYQVIGVVDDSSDGRPTVAPWLGPLSRLGRIVDATRPNRIIVAQTERRFRASHGPLLEARRRGVKVEEAVSFLERVTGKIAIEFLTSHSLILSDGFRHVECERSDLSLAITRVLNLVGALVGLVLFAPLLAAIAVAIKLDSPGPVFFVHERVGRDGREFGLIKFRTMHEPTGWHSEWVRDNEDRITRVGRWLRRFRLDELPQFVNVLRGEMSIVGPRPHPVSNYELFMERIPFYRMRTSVRPGLTGWAQVRYGYANGLDEEIEKMRYDLFYIKHRTLWFDLRILIETMVLLVSDRRSHETVRHPVSLPRWNEAWSRRTPGVTLS